MAGINLALKLTPHGRLVLEESIDAHELAPELAHRLQESFSRGPGFGLLQLGAREVSQTVPAVFAYWREFAARFVTALCTRTADDVPFITPDPPAAELAQLSLSPPEMTGAEYITPDVLRALWHELGAAFSEEMSTACLPLQQFLKSLIPHGTSWGASTSIWQRIARTVNRAAPNYSLQQPVRYAPRC